MVASIRGRLSRDFAAGVSKTSSQMSRRNQRLKLLYPWYTGHSAPAHRAKARLSARCRRSRVHDPAVILARILALLRHRWLEQAPLVVSQIESHDPPQLVVNQLCCL
jgi:hypothetical protein